MSAVTSFEGRQGLSCDQGMPEPAGPLAPLLAGARARGMVDAFDLLGHGAVLIDWQGAALHVSERARSQLGAALTLSQGRLAAADLASDRLLQAGLNAVLAGREECAGPIVLQRGAGQEPLSLRIVAVNAGDEFAQLSRAVILVGCADPLPGQNLF